MHLVTIWISFCSFTTKQQLIYHFKLFPLFFSHLYLLSSWSFFFYSLFKKQVPTYPWDGMTFSNSSTKWYTRVSAQIYNDETDFQMLADAVLDILSTESNSTATVIL